MSAENVITGMFSSYVNESPKLTPRTALLFFTNKTGHHGNETLIATSHPLTQNCSSPAPVIGAGHLLSEADTKEVLESLLERIPTHTGFIPSEVLSMSSKHIAWTVKGAVRPMYFRPRGTNKKIIKLNVPMPNLLFVATANGFSIAAYKGSRRPTEKTKLYHAPLMNIYRDAGVCLGSANMPQQLSLDSRKAIEDIIFKTNFSHINHEQTLSLSKTISDKAHLAFWRTLNKEKATVFPNKALAPLKVSVEQLITRVVKK
jgi:PRTRC genetic system protein B